MSVPQNPRLEDLSWPCVILVAVLMVAIVEAAQRLAAVPLSQYAPGSADGLVSLGWTTFFCYCLFPILTLVFFASGMLRLRDIRQGLSVESFSATRGALRWFGRQEQIDIATGRKSLSRHLLHHEGSVALFFVVLVVFWISSPVPAEPSLVGAFAAATFAHVCLYAAIEAMGRCERELIMGALEERGYGEK